MSATVLRQFAERYRVALDTARQTHPDRGICGIEVEWNVVNGAGQPVGWIDEGDDRVSLADALYETHLPAVVRERIDLEAFTWMTETVTRPYYEPSGAVYEARLLEAALHNALSAIGDARGEALFPWHGNITWPINVSADDVPRGWDLAKQRYIARCVDVYGANLATAGIHVNVSLPEPLFSLDYLHQADSVGEDRLVRFRNESYIRAARVLRAFSALFIATSAASPLVGELRDGEAVVVLTDHDANRHLTFPNPPELDLPHLYRSSADYVRLSTDLVRKRLRFGNNNWTPTRARSDSASVEHIINLTSDQLRAFVQLQEERGQSVDIELDRLTERIEQENMIARVELPMARVEVRTDEAGHAMPLDIAQIVFKQLMLLRSYADPHWGAAFTYDEKCIVRARQSEIAASKQGMDAAVQHPFTGATVTVREFLAATLQDLEPLATALDWSDALEPLRQLATGADNTATQIRTKLAPHARDGVVSPDALKELLLERQALLRDELEQIVVAMPTLGAEAAKLDPLLESVLSAADEQPRVPLHFRPKVTLPASVQGDDEVREAVELAVRLIRLPSVTTGGPEHREAVWQASQLCAGLLERSGLDVRLFEDGPYPALLATFPGQAAPRVMLNGHVDVVAPSPDESQFKPRIDGDYLWGRGAADMKTVVASYVTWMQRAMSRHANGSYPSIGLMIVGNEENGEAEPTGTPHVFETMVEEGITLPEVVIAGERTGENGDELFGEICTENRGIVRLALVASGSEQHTGVSKIVSDLGERLLAARTALRTLLEEKLTLSAADGWKSSYRFPFLSVGQPGVYNITAGRGELGVEIRPIPEDDIPQLIKDVETVAQLHSLELHVQTREPGVICDPDNPHLRTLIESVEAVSNMPARMGKKMPGTSGRFAPRGQAIIWGQSGIGPHAPDERHFIPSISGYLKVLDDFAKRLV